MRFIEDSNARANAIRAGEVSMAQAVPIAQLGELRDLTIDSTPLPRGVYLHLNTSKGEFADPAIRAAAAQAVRPDAIVDSIYEGHAGKRMAACLTKKPNGPPMLTPTTTLTTQQTHTARPSR